MGKTIAYTGTFQAQSFCPPSDMFHDLVPLKPLTNMFSPKSCNR